MKRNLATIGCLAFLVGGGLFLDLVVDVARGTPSCDDTYASNSVGACETNVITCSSFDGLKDDCLKLKVTRQEVKQDFPTECKYLKDNGTNCNLPLADCRRTVECMWDATNNKCVINPMGMFGIWIQAAKRKTVSCN